MNPELKKIKFGQHENPKPDTERERRLKKLSDDLDDWAAVHRLIDQKSRAGGLPWNEPRMKRGSTAYTVEAE